MKILTGIVTALLFIFLLVMVDVSRVGQSERGFNYKITSGQPVSAEENPDLGFGWHLCWGWNCKFFVISSEVHSWNFTANTEDASSPFNESLTWDSTEGVTMQVGYTIRGRVTDLWKFYANFGRVEGNYSNVDGIDDVRIYEALRQAGDYLDVQMGELGAARAADEIRKAPTAIAEELRDKVASYMEPFGFTVTEVLFPEEMTFPGGNAIKKSRELLRDAAAQIQAAEQEKLEAVGLAAQQIAQAGIDAARTTGEANRKADEILSNVTAETARLKMLIDSSGSPEAAIEQEIALIRAEILGSDAVDQVILTDDSTIGKAFKAE